MLVAGVCAIAGLPIAADAVQADSAPVEAPAPACDQRATGVASWYGPNLHGNPTASGERFDQNALTAAHRSLPLPSLVRVRNLQNGEEIVVRVNDRGPYTRGRMIDLSRAAAQRLDFIRAGEAQVEMCYLGPAPATET